MLFQGIHQYTTSEEITEDVKIKGYPTEEVIPVVNKSGLPMLMVTTEVAKEYKSIYNVTDCCNIIIKVEFLCTRQGII